MAAMQVQSILTILALFGALLGLGSLFYGFAMLWDDWSAARGIMGTMHATQILNPSSGSLDASIGSMHATLFWAMFLPTYTEDPSSSSSHTPSIAYVDMCHHCSDEKCNPVYGKDNGQLKHYNQCISGTDSKNALKCNSETLHNNVIEHNERTSLGFTGSARAETLYGTIVLGLGLVLFYSCLDILDAATYESAESNYTKTLNMVKWIVFLIVAILFTSNSIASSSNGVKIDADKIDANDNNEIKALWNDIDNTDIYCLLFLLAFGVGLIYRKNNISRVMEVAKNYDNRGVVDDSNALEANKKLVAVNDDVHTTRSAMDLGAVFLFQFYVWYTVVQNNRVVLDTMLQKHFVAAAAIGVVVLVSNEIAAALYSFREMRRNTSKAAGENKYADKAEEPEKLFAWHSAVISLASLAFVFFFWFFAIQQDAQQTVDGNVLQTVFWVLIGIPQILTLAYMLLQSVYQNSMSFSSFLLLIDIWKLGFFIILFFTIVTRVETDNNNKKLFTSLDEHVCETNCDEDAFKFRAEMWMRDLVTLTNSNPGSITSLSQYYCDKKLYPAYTCH